jgi:hypothetical protein
MMMKMSMMIDPDPHSSSSSSFARAVSALKTLGFMDADQLVGRYGAQRVLAAEAYTRTRRNIRNPGGFIRRLLEKAQEEGGGMPAPLVWPDEQGRWRSWHSLNGQKPEPARLGRVCLEDQEPEAADLWRRALEELRVHVTKPNYETWLKDSVGVRLDDERLVVLAVNESAAEWLSTKLRPLIAKTVSGLIGRMMEVEVAMASEEEQ